MYNVTIYGLTEPAFRRHAAIITDADASASLIVITDDHHYYDLRIAADMVTTVHTDKRDQVVVVVHDRTGRPRFINLDRNEYFTVEIK